MNILFLGASSFTGFHFVNQLSKVKNIKIYCTLTKNINQYESLRYMRIKLLSKKENVIFVKKIKFGDKKFTNLLEKIRFNVFCFHHALTKNYNDNSKFNLKKSLKENTNNIEEVFRKIDYKATVIISNTIFQNIPSKKYRAVNNYGISKSQSFDKIRLLCEKNNIKFRSIYITNPWGIYEEKKLNFYLIKNWLNNKNAKISHPNYIRDNIHIDLLSKMYKKIVLSKSNKINYFPSGICSTNKLFIEALRNKFEKFFNKKVEVAYENKAIYNQPMCRINGNKIVKNVKIKQNLNKYFAYYQKLLSS
ncbi:hypothetical protein [Candidatus Pelagibacter sp. HIMB1506]|uniref:hypothetical protein n=1 Tax=Candidatus Pelagibacter sp. HIMB1506 TaxID=3413337 RepID=UPI003F849DEC